MSAIEQNPSSTTVNTSDLREIIVKSTATEETARVKVELTVNPLIVEEV